MSNEYQDFLDKMEEELAIYNEEFESLPPNSLVTIHQDLPDRAVLKTDEKGKAIGFAQHRDMTRIKHFQPPKVQDIISRYGDGQVFDTRIYVAPVYRNQQTSTKLLNSLFQIDKQVHDEKYPSVPWYFVDKFVDAPPGSDLAAKRGSLVNTLQTYGYQKVDNLFVRVIQTVPKKG